MLKFLKYIKFFIEEFDQFVFYNGMDWGLAFYKCCALDKMLRKDYEYYCLLDLDTYTQSAFEDLFHECKYWIMLHDRHKRL